MIFNEGVVIIEIIVKRRALERSVKVRSIIILRSLWVTHVPIDSVFASHLESICDNSVSRYISKHLIIDIGIDNSSFSRRMIVRAISSFLANFGGWAGLDLVVKGMILVFFPAMTFVTLFLIRASIFIIENKVRGFPIGARGWFVAVHIWFSSVILPIVGINTKSLVMGG
jgi:hypothetical protein